MSSRLALAAASVLILAACGDGAQAPAEPAAPPPPPAPMLSDAEKAALLAALPAPYDQADLDNGRRAFARCRSCHTITPGGAHMTGPNLWRVFGRQAGTAERFNYSQPVRAAGFAWDAERLDHWLENPRTFLPGNKMSFAGMPDATDRRDLIAWLKIETGYGAEAAPPAT